MLEKQIKTFKEFEEHGIEIKIDDKLIDPLNKIQQLEDELAMIEMQTLHMQTDMLTTDPDQKLTVDER